MAEAHYRQQQQGRPMQYVIRKPQPPPPKPVKIHTTLWVTKPVLKELRRLKPSGVTNEGFLTLLLQLWEHDQPKFNIAIKET
jgi:hypothetical protein